MPDLVEFNLTWNEYSIFFARFKLGLLIRMKSIAKVGLLPKRQSVRLFE